ncbi:Response regulator receiver protein [Paraburkholderia piptadeniae]|uniref:Response regulator receiver protein n=1 Tax=Paraburkholderia piptadeniae TaxID=1701573 RepID=A0A1N7SDR6_9BURK|nr:response regulator receiver protein [Paraburkholderia piptadeniae]SIT45484.1 Response regulator receiver protein [Paraburkholderia piptadeniae]
MLDTAVFRNGFRSPSARTTQRPSRVARSHSGVVPYALVYVDTDSVGSPNSTSVDPFAYLQQAITLNRSLLAAGLPRLTVATNVADRVEHYLADIAADWRPDVLQLRPSTLELPKATRFYGTHFKLDLLAQAAATLDEGQLLMLLDTDMLALRGVSAELLLRCRATGVGAYDITDQEFSAYGESRVIADLETVAGKRLVNPRWFGGEALLASAAFIDKLGPRARACFERYRSSIDQLNHNGDETFISAALNLLAEEGQQIIDLGAHRLVGRHWSGNTHRDLRWFKGCTLLHLPDSKRLLERQARHPTFSVARILRRVVLAHAFNRMLWPLRRWRRARSRLRRMPASHVARVDVLILDPDTGRLSALASRLTSRGVVVMPTVTLEEARDAARRLDPRVIVTSSRIFPGDRGDVLDTIQRSAGRPVMIAFSSDDARLDWTQWDGWFPRSADPGEVVEAVMEALGRR